MKYVCDTRRDSEEFDDKIKVNLIPKEDNSSSDLIKINIFDESLENINKKRTLFAVLVTLCIGNMMIRNVISFLPIYIAQKTW